MALTELAGGNFFVLLILAAVGAIVLGMGMPVLAAYVLVVLLVSPALTKIGMDPLSAHMFVFYFAVLSFLTPPMCLAVYTAASLANSSPMKTAVHAVRLGIAAYIVPFVFAFSPALLFIGSSFDIFTAVVLAFIGIVLLSVGLEGYLFRNLSGFERVLGILGGVGLMSPFWIGRTAGAVLTMVLILWQWARRKSAQTYMKGKG
jgi:TRAP-type uncharacterized transport system fused permease subunit